MLKASGDTKRNYTSNIERSRNFKDYRLRNYQIRSQRAGLIYIQGNSCLFRNPALNRGFISVKNAILDIVIKKGMTFAHASLEATAKVFKHQRKKDDNCSVYS